MEKKNPFNLVASKKSRFILPNLLTIIGVCLGISSIKFALDDNYSLAVIFLVLAAILDALDGRIARLIKGTTEFGKELDSLTDFVSFGIAPAFILYFWELKNYGKVGWTITLIFSVCCVLRLARFNLTKISEDEEWKLNFFEGVPSPAGGILVLTPLIVSVTSFDYITLNYDIIVPTFFIVTSLLLISKFPSYSLKKIVIQRKATIFLLFGIILFFGLLLVYPFNVIAISSIIYLLMLPISFFHYQKLKKQNLDKNLGDDDDELEDVL